MAKTAVVRMDQVPDVPGVIVLLSQQHARALVIWTGTTSTRTSLALAKVALPLRVGLAHVVPEARDKGEVASAEGTGALTREFGDVAQVVGQRLTLPFGILGVRIERHGRDAPSGCSKRGGPERCGQPTACLQRPAGRFTARE